MSQTVKLYPGQNYYWVSSDGYVCTKWKTLKPILNKRTGYCRVALRLNGITVHKSLHRVIAETFLENPENKEQVNHKDFNRQNNSVDNLEWCTRLENAEHGTKHKRWNVPKINARGSKNHSSKLKEKDVEYIRSNWKDGRTNKPGKSGVELAKMFNVLPCTISAIVKGTNWKYS